MTRTQFWNASLSIRVKPYMLKPSPPSRHCFGTLHANNSHYRSLGLNLECVMSHLRKVELCVGVTDTGLHIQYMIKNVHFLSYIQVHLSIFIQTLALNNIFKKP